MSEKILNRSRVGIHGFGTLALESKPLNEGMSSRVITNVGVTLPLDLSGFHGSLLSPHGSLRDEFDLTCANLAQQSRHKGSLLIQKHELATLNVDNHIQFAIMVHISEGERHQRQILSWPQQGGTAKHHAFGDITTGNLDYDDVSVQVHSDKMAGVLW